jgi:hypothetical protein
LSASCLSIDASVSVKDWQRLIGPEQKSAPRRCAI